MGHVEKRKYCPYRDSNSDLSCRPILGYIRKEPRSRQACSGLGFDSMMSISAAEMQSHDDGVHMAPDTDQSQSFIIAVFIREILIP
jgi:hypothetical protein